MYSHCDRINSASFILRRIVYALKRQKEHAVKIMLRTILETSPYCKMCTSWVVAVVVMLSPAIQALSQIVSLLIGFAGEIGMLEAYSYNFALMREHFALTSGHLRDVVVEEVALETQVQAKYKQPTASNLYLELHSNLVLNISETKFWIWVWIKFEFESDSRIEFRFECGSGDWTWDSFLHLRIWIWIWIQIRIWTQFYLLI